MNPAGARSRGPSTGRPRGGDRAQSPHPGGRRPALLPRADRGVPRRGGIRDPDRVERGGGAPPARALLLRHRADRPGDAGDGRERARPPREEPQPGSGHRGRDGRGRREDRRRRDEARGERLPAQALRPAGARALPGGHPPEAAPAERARAPAGGEHRVHGRAAPVRTRPRAVRLRRRPAARRAHRRGPLPGDAGAGRGALGPLRRGRVRAGRSARDRARRRRAGEARPGAASRRAAGRADRLAAGARRTPSARAPRRRCWCRCAARAA